jgi:hypothetical protein
MEILKAIRSVGGGKLEQKIADPIPAGAAGNMATNATASAP